jgi:hypothetical protein
MDAPASQQQVAAVPTAGDVEQTGDAVGRVESQRHLRKAESRAVGGDPKILRDGEHEAAAEGVAVDGGQRHLRQRGEAVHHRGVACGERLGVLAGDDMHLLDVVAGAKGAASAGHQQHPHVAHGGHALKRLLQRYREVAVERVQGPRPVQREPQHAVGRGLEQDEIVGAGWRGHG